MKKYKKTPCICIFCIINKYLNLFFISKNDEAELDELDEENVLHFPEFGELLLERYMPYCFIWSGIVMRGTDVTRWTNGMIEKYISTRKSILDLWPACYSRRSMRLSDANIIEYEAEHDEKKKKLLKIKPSKATKPIKSAVDTRETAVKTKYEHLRKTTKILYKTRRTL